MVKAKIPSTLLKNVPEPVQISRRKIPNGYIVYFWQSGVFRILSDVKVKALDLCDGKRRISDIIKSIEDDLDLPKEVIDKEFLSLFSDDEIMELFNSRRP